MPFKPSNQKISFHIFDKSNRQEKIVQVKYCYLHGYFKVEILTDERISDTGILQMLFIKMFGFNILHKLEQIPLYILVLILSLNFHIF